MKKPSYILILLILMVAGCGTWQPGGATRVPTELRVLAYNDISDAYLPRPTFLTLRERVGASSMLQITVDQYGEDSDLYISKAAAPLLSDAVSKFAEWEAIAMQRGDLLDKEIAVVEGEAGMEYTASLHSGNETLHYMVIRQCYSACSYAQDSETYYFDRENALILKATLDDFSSGRIQPKDSDLIYK